jgi:hypothetical protein
MFEDDAIDEIERSSPHEEIQALRAPVRDERCEKRRITLPSIQLVQN